MNKNTRRILTLVLAPLSYIIASYGRAVSEHPNTLSLDPLAGGWDDKVATFAGRLIGAIIIAWIVGWIISFCFTEFKLLFGKRPQQNIENNPETASVGMHPRPIRAVVAVTLASALVAAVAVPLSMPLLMRRTTDTKQESVALADINAGPGRVIRITVEANSQQTISFHYHIMIDGILKVEHAFFGTLPRTAPPPSFVIHADGQGDLVGIALAAVPNRIIILHDFQTGESWPMRKVTYRDSDTERLYPMYEEAAPIMARGESLFARLREELPNQNLELHETMGMRPLDATNIIWDTPERAKKRGGV